MRSKQKLEVILRSLEVEERGALEEKLRIEEIADARVKGLSGLVEERTVLYSKLDDLSQSQKRALVGGSKAVSPAEIQAFKGRINKQIEELKVKIDKADEQYKLARERLELAENELLEARIGRKKVEKLLDSKKAREQVKQEMVEERLLEEYSSEKVHN